MRETAQTVNVGTQVIQQSDRLRSLHLRGTVVAFAASVIMALLTAGVCHGYLAATHAGSPLLPVLLFGAVFWVWWGVVAVALWWLAQQWPPILTCSIPNATFHIVLGCLLAVKHLEILEWLTRYSSRHWSNDWTPLDYMNIMRFGFELLLYGFVLGFSGLLHMQSKAHRDAMRSLELEKQLSQAQLKALQMQMEPHFLFNTLNAVTTLVELNRNEKAVEILAHLNTILRKTLQRGTPEKIPFSQELEIVESYLAIQQVRFADRLRVRIDITPEALEGMVPCFLLQPIIENAVRHGISRIEGTGVLETSVTRIGDRLNLCVRDNGPGTKGPVAAKNGYGIGMRNTQERLLHFYPGAYDFTVTEPESGGYEVTIQIPYERRSL
jgi:hypothetical protein